VKKTNPWDRPKEKSDCISNPIKSKSHPSKKKRSRFEIQIPSKRKKQISGIGLRRNLTEFQIRLKAKSNPSKKH
jgi:hypothetical protein